MPLDFPQGELTQFSVPATFIYETTETDITHRLSNIENIKRQPYSGTNAPRQMPENVLYCITFISD